MTVHAVPQSVLSMRDIADLCGVRRPVVSAWRQRERVHGEVIPFPEPVSDDGVQLFDSGAVVSWLAHTRRGNNPDFREDIAAYARPPALTKPGADVYDAVMSLLCLKALTGRSLSGLDEYDLLDLADQVDPDDEALYREVEQLGSDGPALAGYADALTEASYGVEAAADRVRSRRARDSGQGLRAVSLAPPVHKLVGQLVAALAIDLASAGVMVWDVTGGATDLAQAAVAALSEQMDCSLGVPGEGLAARRRRREALISGLILRTSLAADEPAVTVGQFPHEASPDMTTGEVLTAIDDVQLELGIGQRAVILGPAAVLCDRLRDPETDRHRDDLIRGLGRLRAVVRLPAGLILGRSREQLGLWILGPAQQEARADRWVATADLPAQELTDAVIGDLVTDVVTAMGSVRIGSTHSFRFAGVVRTADLLAGRGDLVALGVLPDHGRPAQSAEVVLAVERLMGSLRDRHPGPQLAGWSVSPGDDSAGVRAVSLGSLVTRRGVTRVPGTRMSAPTPTSSGGVRVLGVDDVVTCGESPAAWIDPLTLEAAYPRARRTEPGDVVFVTSPRPAAIVDRDGLSVVRYPARVLHCADGFGVVPDVVAATINALPRAARAWRTWQIPVASPGSTPALGDALAEVQADRQRTHQRLRELDELSCLLIDGVASGAMTIARTAEPSSTGEIS